MREFDEAAHALAFHPSGYQIIVAFTNKIRMLNIFIDGIVPYKDIAIKNCKEIRFSPGG